MTGSGDKDDDAWTRLRRLTPARIALGRVGAALPTAEVLRFSLAHAQARDAVHAVLDIENVCAGVATLGYATTAVSSDASDRATYLVRPDFGRRLAAKSRSKLRRPKSSAPVDVGIVIADGLSARAVDAHAVALLAALKPWIVAAGWSVPAVVVAKEARVALGDEIGERLGARSVVMLIGERPGLSSPDSLGAYITVDPKIGRTDAERNCISNIRDAGLSYDLAAFKIAWLLAEAFKAGATGVQLKDESDALLMNGKPPAPRLAKSM